MSPSRTNPAQIALIRSVASFGLFATYRKDGAPGGARTPDLLIRSQSLYPTELRARLLLISYLKNGHFRPELSVPRFFAKYHVSVLEPLPPAYFISFICAITPARRLCISPALARCRLPCPGKTHSKVSSSKRCIDCFCSSHEYQQ